MGNLLIEISWLVALQFFSVTFPIFDNKTDLLYFFQRYGSKFP